MGSIIKHALPFGYWHHFFAIFWLKLQTPWKDLPTPYLWLAVNQSFLRYVLCLLVLWLSWLDRWLIMEKLWTSLATICTFKWFEKSKWNSTLYGILGRDFSTWAIAWQKAHRLCVKTDMSLFPSSARLDSRFLNPLSSSLENQALN